MACASRAKGVQNSPSWTVATQNASGKQQKWVLSFLCCYNGHHSGEHFLCSRTVLSPSCLCIYLGPHDSFRDEGATMPMLQMETLRFREEQ